MYTAYKVVAKGSIQRKHVAREGPGCPTLNLLWPGTDPSPEFMYTFFLPNTYQINAMRISSVHIGMGGGSGSTPSQGQEKIRKL